MPRPKSELTKNCKMVGIRLTEANYEQWKLLGGAAWLRTHLTKLADKKKRNEQAAKTLPE